MLYTADGPYTVDCVLHSRLCPRKLELHYTAVCKLESPAFQMFLYQLPESSAKINPGAHFTEDLKAKSFISSTQTVWNF